MTLEKALTPFFVFDSIVSIVFYIMEGIHTMQKKILKRISWIAMVSVFFATFVGCFGKFPLVRKLYEFNSSLGDSSMVGRFIRTLVMWVMMFFPIYSIAGLIDMIILNLIEFWTGKVVVHNEATSPETVVSGDTTLAMTRSADGNAMTIDISRKDGKRESFTVFKNRPGQFFTAGGEPIEFNTHSLDQETIEIVQTTRGIQSSIKVKRDAFERKMNRVESLYELVMNRQKGNLYASAKPAVPTL